jgi:hypothetical protein
MLAAPCLSPCSQHMRAASAVARILAAGGRVAVRQESGPVLLFDEDDLGVVVSEVELQGRRCTAAAWWADGSCLLLGGDGLLQLVALPPGQQPSTRSLALAGCQPDGPVACIAATRSHFAIGESG